MSKSKKEWWTTYEEMHKVAKIIRDVLGWECFTSWENYQYKYGMQEWGYIAGEKFVTPTPVAFYEGEWRVWSPDHETLDIFDPLHKLDDAWLLIEPIKKHAHSGTVRSRFVEAVKLLDHAWRHYTKEQFCQAICDAALCILDREVPLSEELPDPGAIDTYIWFLVDEVYENIPINDIVLDLYQKYVWSLDDQNRDRVKEMKCPVFAPNILIDYVQFHYETVAYCVECLCSMGNVTRWRQEIES